MPSTTEPTGWALTNWRKVSGSLMGSSCLVGRRRRPRPAPSTDASSVMATVPEARVPEVRMPAASATGSSVGATTSAAARAAPATSAAGSTEGRRPRRGRGSATPALDIRDAGALVVAFLALDPRASRVERRLSGPRTGDRSTNTQPTPGMGLPPTRRPSSNSHVYWPWNSWKESLEKTVASALLAMDSTNASPRPMAPAGGETSSPARTASSKVGFSLSSMRCPKVASTTTVTSAAGNSSWKERTASSSWLRLGCVRPSVAMFDPSTTTCSLIIRIASQAPARTGPKDGDRVGPSLLCPPWPNSPLMSRTCSST